MKKTSLLVWLVCLFYFPGFTQINLNQYNCYTERVVYTYGNENAKGVLCWMTYKDTVETFLNYSMVMLLDNQHGNKLISDKDQLPINVYDARVSEDSRFIALLEVGEGHPWIEILDLQKLLQTGKVEILAEINPYPGSVNLLYWKKGKLWVESDANLLNKNKSESLDIEDISEKSSIYSWDMDTRKFSKEKTK